MATADLRGSAVVFFVGASVFERALAIAGALCLCLAGTPARAATLSGGGSPPAKASTAGSAPFDVLEFRVLGNTTLAVREVERAVYAALGPQRSIHDVESARDSLVKAYRDHGYGAVFVEIPEQEVTDGIVRLQVTEGRLGRVHVTGARYFENGRIRAELPALVPGQVLNFQSLQGELADVNRENRDRTVTPVLRAGATPGTVDLDLKVADSSPLHGSVALNNRYTANTSPLRTSVNLSYDNLFQRYQSLSLQYQVAPASPQQSRIAAATYVIPFSSTRQLALYAVNTNSDVSAIGALSVIGAGTIVGMRDITALPPSGSFFHSLTVGVDYKDFEQRIRLPTSLDRSPIKYLAWTLNYAANLQTPATLSAFTIGPTLGIRGLLNKPDQFDFNRFDAAADFIYLRANISHERPLFLGSRLFLRLAGQVTPGPLINNEQIAVGGADTVRGYLEADTLGDIGYDSALEWRTPNLGALLRGTVTRAYAFTFFDAGFTRLLEPLPKQIDSTRLESWGVGVRVALWSAFDLSLDWAEPLKSTSNTHAGDSRLLFEVSGNF